METHIAAAYANLAFVKYWGKRDPLLNIPLNSSISMTLSAARTETSVMLTPEESSDTVYIGPNKQPASTSFAARVTAHLDRLRRLAGVSISACVITHNAFPMGAGFASSASGMAALTVAGASAFGLNLSEAELSALARVASGSACRSIPAGFVEWEAGTNHNDSFAHQIAPPDYWDIVDVAVVVSAHEKDVPSSEGHQLALNSPFWSTRLETLPHRLEVVRRSILERDFEAFGRELESEAMSMHAVALTSAYIANGIWRSGIYYILPDTLEIMAAVQAWRAHGLPVYFTLDAGPTVHLITRQPFVSDVTGAVRKLEAQRSERQWQFFVSHPAPGARLISVTSN